ncbi:AHH domain-containing protein [Virgibacillus sp. Bac330]|uniref:AHH domain-containing protein n=1 Tax=Virgibacillus sp. Bac330 TaxID=2419841 RepID=UPI001F099F30|nr:AHH domain-containing protein [Virgibacillus sp. Bac330]
MKRDLQINYGVLDDIIGELRKYKSALGKMDDSLDKVSTFVQTNEGKSVEAWDQNINTSKEKIANYETQINDLLSLFENYVTDTTRYISPISRNTMMRVDRNDIWANLKQIEGGITNNLFKALNKSYQQPASFFGMFDDPTDAEKEASEINRRHMERIQTSIEATRKKLERNMDELWDLYNSKVKKFENADDEYNNLAGNVKRKYTNFFEGVMDVVSSVNKAVDDFEKGIVNSIAGMVTGLLTVVKDAGVVAVSGVVPDPVEPSWLKESADETVDAYTQAAIQFLQDPMRAVESTAQSFTDNVEQEGVMYVTGATIPALIPSSMAVKGVSGVAKLGAGAARRAPKLLDSKPFSGNYYLEKVDAAKAGMAKVKMPVFYREQLSTGDSTIPTAGMRWKPLGDIRPQMFAVKNGGGGKIEAKGTGNTVNDYLDDIIVNGDVDAVKMNKLKNEIQNNTFNVDELSEIRKRMSELGISKEYDEALIKIDFGKYLRELIGEPPSAMIDPHAHHILFKKGLGQKQQELVQEGQEILKKYGIEPVIGKENLVWAPNRIAGQHGIERLQHIVNKLKEVDSFGGNREKIVEMLKLLGEEAALMK